MQDAVDISSGVSPEVGITTSPTLLRYTSSTLACVVLTIVLTISLYVVYNSPYKIKGFPESEISAFESAAPLIKVPRFPIVSVFHITPWC